MTAQCWVKIGRGGLQLPKLIPPIRTCFHFSKETTSDEILSMNQITQFNKLHACSP